MNQSRVDSFMEAVTNMMIGYWLSVGVWAVTAWFYELPMPLAQNLQIVGIFTVSSIIRQYVLRRMFNGRSLWDMVKKLR